MTTPHPFDDIANTVLHDDEKLKNLTEKLPNLAKIDLDERMVLINKMLTRFADVQSPSPNHFKFLEKLCDLYGDEHRVWSALKNSRGTLWIQNMVTCVCVLIKKDPKLWPYISRFVDFDALSPDQAHHLVFICVVDYMERPKVNFASSIKKMLELPKFNTPESHGLALSVVLANPPKCFDVPQVIFDVLKNQSEDHHRQVLQKTIKIMKIMNRIEMGLKKHAEMEQDLALMIANDISNNRLKKVMKEIKDLKNIEDQPLSQSNFYKTLDAVFLQKKLAHATSSLGKASSTKTSKKM